MWPATSTSSPTICSGGTAEKCGWQDYQIIARFPGAAVEHAVFRHPFLDRDSLGILADHVTLEQGTGAVHTAPGHGQEDYVVARQYGIATYCPVDAAGRFYHAEGASGRLPEELIGKTVWEANPIVLGILQSAGALLAQEKVQHSYPHCWRCHNPTIFRATEQWFIGMERNDLRQRALDAIRKVKWMPSWGEQRISNMIATRPDWCISRQRVWGVPIIAFYCGNCLEPITDRKYLDPVVAEFAIHTADIWYSRTAAELLPPGTLCPKCGAAEFTKESDILDVWFDSGSSHLAVLTPANQLPWPADLYLEGGDQYRGWFHSSLLIGVALRGAAPYRGSATHGWTLDAEGRAMHKSLGNSIEPDEIIKKYGAEVLRLWVASVEFTEDVRLSETILTRLTEAYRKLRNTFRYALGNISDFDPAADAVPVDDNAGDRPVDSGPRRRSGLPLPRLVRRVRVPQDLSRGLRLRHRRPQLHLLRCAERPPLHLGRPLQRPAQRADRAPSRRLRAGAPGRSIAGLHGRGSLEAHAATRQRAYRVFSGARKSSPPAYPPNIGNAWRTGTV